MPPTSGSDMQIVFAGSGTFGLPTLAALVEGGQDVGLLVTQPDRPAGRGQVVQTGPLARFAKDRDIPILQPEDINTPANVRRIREARPDLLLVIAFGQKIGPELLRMPRHGAVNLHASLLPKYRGAAPINWALINGDPETGLSVIRMTDRIDAGDILGQRATVIQPDETAGDLMERLAKLGARLVTEVVREIPLDEAEPRRQNESQVSQAPRLKKLDGRIDWARAASEVHNHIRGVTPWPGAFTGLAAKAGGEPLRLVITRTTVPVDASAAGEPGTILQAGAAGLDVATARGVVRILELTPAGKRPMTAAAFVNGCRIEPGARFAAADQKVGADS